MGTDHRLGAGALSVSGPAAVRCHCRHSLRAADRGGRRRADAVVRAEGLARRAAGVELGIKVAFTPIGIFLAMVFIGIPFVVRTVQPVLIDLDVEIEEAAACLGATRWHTMFRVILPSLTPALLTGFALAFARAVGEYGSVIFIAGNLPNVSEIAPLLIVIRLSEFRYADATAIAVVMLLVFVPDHLRRQSAAALGADAHPRMGAGRRSSFVTRRR